MTRDKEVPQVMRGIYTIPECSVQEIQAEGPLCTSLLLMRSTSIEQLEEIESEYNW